MSAKRRRSLALLYREIQRDPAFGHLRSGGVSFVPGHGSYEPRLVLVGEAPGRQEDEQGIPFVGKAGKKLDELLEYIDLGRREIWITNVVKYRPPGNRTPTKDEIEAATPYILRELRILDCPIVGLVGLTASGLVFPNVPMWMAYNTVESEKFRWHCIALYHPASVMHARDAEERQKIRHRMIEGFEKIGDMLADEVGLVIEEPTGKPRLRRPQTKKVRGGYGDARDL